MDTTAPEKTVGTNLTTIAEYSDTAIALADLQHRFKNLVVDVSTSKGLKEAKAMTFELRTLRTSLEKKRKDLKAPILERGKALDDEAKRITAQIVELEEPIDIQIKTEETRIQNEELARLEALRLRDVAIKERIQAMRDLPASVAGKPAIIIATALGKLEKTELVEEDFGEHYQTALDARDATIGRLTAMHAAQRQHEAEQAQIKADRERLEQLEREAEERRIADEQKAAAERAEADRLAQVERDRVATEEARLRALEQARLDEIARAEREEQDRIRAEQAEADRVRREQEEAALQAERERQAAEQKKLDEQAEQLRKEKAAAAKKAEAERLANLGLREAAQAVVDHFSDRIIGKNVPQCLHDLKIALINDAAQAKPVRTKRAVQA